MMSLSVPQLVLASILVTCIVGFTSRQGRAADVTLEPIIDGTQQTTGFPFPSSTYTTTADSLRANFSQSQSHANVSRTENKFAMEFDLSSIPTGSVVTSATLSWTELTDFLSPGNTHPLTGYVGDGAFTHADFFGGTSLGQVASGTTDGRVSFDVTSFIADRVAAANHYVGFAVTNGGHHTESTGMFSSFTTVGTYQIASRLQTDPAHRPRLAITVVPEASSPCLVACGILALLAMRVRVKSDRSPGTPSA